MQNLCEAALHFASDTLKPGGHLVCKFYTGAMDKSLEQQLKVLFSEVYREKPESSRAVSFDHIHPYTRQHTDNCHRKARRRISLHCIERPRLLLITRINIQISSRFNATMNWSSRSSIWPCPGTKFLGSNDIKSRHPI